MGVASASRLKKNLFADLLAATSLRRLRRFSVVRRWKTWIWKRWTGRAATRPATGRGRVEQRLNRHHDERGARTCCGCGQPARFAGRRSKQVESVSSPTMERANLSLRLRPRLLSSRSAPGHRKYLALSGAHAYDWERGALVSFQEGSALLTNWQAWLWRPAGGENAEAWKRDRRDERVHTEALDASFSTADLVSRHGRQGFLTAQELVARTGKQPDGSARRAR